LPFTCHSTATHKHTSVSRKLHEELRHIFEEFRTAQNAIHALPPLSVVKATDNFQLELIVLQGDTELKQNFVSMKLVEFFGWFS